MIISQGPKTFSLMSVLLSVRYPDVKLWDIITTSKKADLNHGSPAAVPVIVKASFIHDEVEND